jgi:hypothetical protein
MGRCLTSVTAPTCSQTAALLHACFGCCRQQHIRRLLHSTPGSTVSVPKTPHGVPSRTACSGVLTAGHWKPYQVYKVTLHVTAVSCVVCVAAGIGVAGQALGAYLLSTEMVGPQWRGVAGIITQVSAHPGVLLGVSVSVTEHEMDVFRRWST